MWINAACLCQVLSHRETQKCNGGHVPSSLHESVFACVTPSCRPIAEPSDQTAASTGTEADRTLKWMGLGGVGKERHVTQSLSREMGKREVRVRTSAKQDMAFHQFPSFCSPSHADASLLCHREASETRFLFCSSRNVGHPDKLAFH